MNSRTCQLVTMLLFCAGLSAQGSTCDAQTIWRKALERRGDVDAVRSLAIHSGAPSKTRPVQVKFQGVTVFGDGLRSWTWNDLGLGEDSMFPPSATLVSLDTGEVRALFAGGGNQAVSWDAEGVWVHLLVLLPDSKWGSIRPIKCVENDAEFVVVGVWRSTTLHYHLEKKSLFPSKVDVVALAARRNGTPLEVTLRYELGDYRAVDNIWLPHRRTRKPGQRDEATSILKYEVNPKINPDLFTSPLSVEEGPSQWRDKQ